MDDFTTQQQFTTEWRSLLAQAEGDRHPIIDIDVPDDEDDWEYPTLDDVYFHTSRSALAVTKDD